MLSSLPKAGVLLADRGYDADWLRKALADREITACIPSRRGRKAAIPHDPVLYRQRHRIKNAFGRLKDWRRVATRLTTDAPSCSCQPAPSPPSSCSGCES